jgi:hypothetical protein
VRVFFAAPPNLTPITHLQKAITLSGVIPEEVLLPEPTAGGTSTESWIRQWAQEQSCAIRTVKNEEEALKLLARGNEGVMVAVISPDFPAHLDLVAKAEAQRIPVFVYRELYRQDPRVNCRFSPVERPDVWLRALTAEHRDFFRRLHGLCAQYGVRLKTGADGDGGVLEFADGTQFEGIDLDKENCKVRPRGSIRYRRIRLD